MSEQIKHSELNDDCTINVTLPNNQWNVIVDWLAHSPYNEAKTALLSLNEQIQKAAENPEFNESKTFTGTLPIKTFNMLIFALGQAPYYVVAEIIQAIYSQGQTEINRLREAANTMPEQPGEKNSKPAVEKAETSTDNISTKRNTRRRTKKAAE